MTAASSSQAFGANQGVVQPDGKFRPAGRLTRAVMRKAHSLWPRKTAAEVAAIAHVLPRAAERWTEGKREISADALARLLRSEQGIHFLVAVMGDARPRWWSALLRMGLVGSIQRRREADLRLLRRVADANRTAEHAAALEASLLVQDAEFHEPYVAGLRASMARPQDFTVDAVAQRRPPRA